MAQQLITLLATVIGAILGLGSPIVTGRISRLEKRRDAERVIATRIIDLFDTPMTLEALLLPSDSLVRRKLYLLAIQLERKGTRDACLQLISVAGDQDKLLELQEAWYIMMNEVGKTFEPKMRRGIGRGGR